ncbi:MAG: hypothetical protein J0H66_11220 [Solirubrobacterales bacterium]|nr:hypothetical protein [Solirubrobacterales bacterium]OJU93528.1 MAG: hypothetical protein BGO23_12825 [Solirubrobacterales bacterium 67-14]
MALFSRGGQTGRERRAMQDHLGELDDMRRSNLSDLGQMTVEMAAQGNFNRQRLSEQAAEVVKIDREADLIARGLEEGLTLQELEDLARGGDGSGSPAR